MGLPAIDFSAYLRAIIQAGQVVEETNIVEVVSDTGLVVGHATYEIVQSNNGVAQEVAVATTAGGTGVAAYTTGLAYMAVDIGVAGAAIAPALGVLAGGGLYELSPEFWERVSNQLINAGQTIGGKVIAYWNGDNISFDVNTIEIIKNALIDAGVFEGTYEPPEIDTQTNELTLHSIELSACKSQCIAFVNSCAGVTEQHKAECISMINNYSGDGLLAVHHYYYASYPESAYSLNLWVDSTPNDTGIRYDVNPFDLGENVGQFAYNGGRIGHWTVGDYYGDTAFFRFYIDNPYYISRWHDFTPQNASGQDICFPHFGTYEPNPSAQPEAVYPDGRPIPNIYPNWLPWEYPITIPSTELPTVYPVKYPGTSPDPYPTQEPAQSPQPEPVPVIIPIIIPELPLPTPDPDPEPIPPPIPDPDPQDEPDPIDEPEEPKPQPEPIDPNPKPTPSPVVPAPSLPDTVASNKLFTVYNPSASELNSLGAYLWDSSIIASIRDIWQNPLDGVISLIQVYATPPTSGRHNIILGFLDSGVGANVVSTQFVTVDCGSVSVPENKFNATDYAPYTSLHLYLPFIGIVELDTNECMNSTINVKYKVDVYTGTCLATVSVTRAEDMPNAPILYTYSGNCSQQIPLTSGNATGMLTALIGGITAGLSVASGGGFGLMAGAQIATQTLTREMFHVSHSGNISANAGIMGQKKPYLIIGRRHGYDANNYSSLYGFPANKTIVLGNHTGYVKVKHCFLKTSATQPEHDEIMALLRNGVIL